MATSSVEHDGQCISNKNFRLFLLSVTSLYPPLAGNQVSTVHKTTLVSKDLHNFLYEMRMIVHRIHYLYDDLFYEKLLIGSRIKNENLLSYNQ